MRRIIPLVLACLIPSAAMADERRDPQSWVAAIIAKNPNLPPQAISTMDEDAVAKAVSLYNEESDPDIVVVADSAVVIVGPSQPAGTPAIIGFFSKGCYVTNQTVTLPSQTPA